jgi:hypothetical protein
MNYMSDYNHVWFRTWSQSYGFVQWSQHFSSASKEGGLDEAENNGLDLPFSTLENLASMVNDLSEPFSVEDDLQHAMSCNISSTMAVDHSRDIDYRLPPPYHPGRTKYHRTLSFDRQTHQ